MTKPRSILSQRLLSGAACAMLLAGACSPAPVASKTADGESAVDAYNRKGPRPAPVAAPVVMASVSAPPPAEATLLPGEAAPPLAAAPVVTTVPTPPTAAAVPPPRQAAAQTPPAGAPAPAATVTRVGGLPDTAGRATVQRVCSSCHSIGLVIAKGRSEDGWSEVIGRMMDNGLQASDDDLQTVHAYLSREFPPK